MARDHAADSLGTFEISDPRYERDDLRHVTVHSAALGGRGDITFYVPPGLDAEEPVPLTVLLHGSYGSHWAWALKGGAHRTAGRLIASGALPKMILAMPSDGLAADATAFLTHDDVDYGAWIVRDVRAAAARVHRGVSGSSPFCIAGLSIGGFGAMYLALRFPELVAAASAHSPVTDLARRYGRAKAGQPIIHRLPNDPALTLLHWAQQNRGRLPPFRFDCGRSDDLCEESRALHRALTADGIPHTYDEFDGAHDWAYWQTHLEDSLRFFARALGAAHR